MLSLEPQKFQTIIDSILFGIKHTKTEIMEISLQSLKDLNTMICNYNQITKQFYVSFYSRIISDLMMVLIDCEHLSEFKTQTQILKQLL